MDDSSPPPSRQVKIRPAGWVVIALLVAGLGWLLFRFAGPHLGPLVDRVKQAARSPSAPTAPAPPTTPEAPPTPVAEDASVLSPSLFPAAVAGLPEPGGLPSLALPAFSGVRIPSGLVPAGGEREALQRLSRGEAAWAVVSVPALAALPQVVEQGARVVWSLGPSPEDAALFPSCDPEALRGRKLGAVTGTAGHLALLSAFAGQPLPTIAGYDTEALLSRAIAEGLVTGGARRLPFGTQGCLTLPVAATTLVVVRGAGVEADASQLAAIAALSRRQEPVESVASFLDPARRTAGGFVDVYEKSQQVWRTLGLIDTMVPASKALDAAASGEPAPSIDGAPSPRSSYGRPSWPERRAAENPR